MLYAKGNSGILGFSVNASDALGFGVDVAQFGLLLVNWLANGLKVDRFGIVCGSDVLLLLAENISPKRSNGGLDVLVLFALVHFSSYFIGNGLDNSLLGNVESQFARELEPHPVLIQ